jgi:hypothetical protein
MFCERCDSKVHSGKSHCGRRDSTLADKESEDSRRGRQEDGCGGRFGGDN